MNVGISDEICEKSNNINDLKLRCTLETITKYATTKCEAIILGPNKTGIQGSSENVNPFREIM